MHAPDFYLDLTKQRSLLVRPRTRVRDSSMDHGRFLGPLGSFGIDNGDIRVIVPRPILGDTVISPEAEWQGTTRDDPDN